MWTVHCYRRFWYLQDFFVACPKINQLDTHHASIPSQIIFASTSGFLLVSFLLLLLSWLSLRISENKNQDKYNQYVSLAQNKWHRLTVNDVVCDIIWQDDKLRSLSCQRWSQTTDDSRGYKLYTQQVGSWYNVICWLNQCYLILLQGGWIHIFIYLFMFLFPKYTLQMYHSKLKHLILICTVLTSAELCPKEQLHILVHVTFINFLAGHMLSLCWVCMFSMCVGFSLILQYSVMVKNIL